MHEILHHLVSLSISFLWALLVAGEEQVDEEVEVLVHRWA
jgi:hypothetical protein